MKTKRRKTAGIIFLLVMLSAAGMTAQAAPGDIAGDIYETNISTQFCGYDIPAFAADGKTLIAAEDLGQYGYTVYYSNDARCLFVTYSSAPGESVPPVERTTEQWTAGKICGHYYESDIRVVVNGEYVQGYALDGKMAVCVEDLGGGDAENDWYGVSPYRMLYSYDDSQRRLSLWNALDRLPSQKVQEEDYIAKFTQIEYLSSEYKIYNGDGFDIVRCTQNGTTHGSYTYYMLFWENGLSINLNTVFDAYGFRDYWGHVLVKIDAISGDDLEFTATKEVFSDLDTGVTAYEGVFEEKCTLDLHTLRLDKLSTKRL